MTLPVLSLTGVSKAFYRGPIRVEVLDSISLTLSPGDYVAVWGGLKAGKTTLLNIAAGLDAPDAGKVRVGGVNLAEMSRRQIQRLRRHDLGYARRTGPHERELTTLEYVAFPLRGTVRSAERQAMAALHRLGMEPECAGLRWDELTDGERTLVSIAHAIVRKPKLLLVDDPTSNLGLHERERTLALLRRLTVEDRTAVLMTAPDMGAALQAHRAFTLTSGRLAAVESPRAGDVVRLPGA
jgi:ABC-type lipoprotein export system ATPase subunit